MFLDHSPSSRRDILAMVATVLLAAPLLVAAGFKLDDQQNFRDVIQASKLAPIEAIDFISWSVPIIEILIAFALAIPRFRVLGLRSAVWMYAFYAAYNGWRIIRGIGVPCSCFGPLFTISPAAVLALDLAFFGLSIFLLRRIAARNVVY